MGVHGGDDIVGAVGTSPVHCNLDWQRGWQRNEVVVHQWVYHCYDDDAVIFFFQSYIIVLKGNPKLHITTIRRVGGRQEQELINPGHIKYNYESQTSPVSPSHIQGDSSTGRDIPTRVRSAPHYNPEILNLTH